MLGTKLSYDAISGARYRSTNYQQEEGIRNQDVCMYNLTAGIIV
jgi:hypothetical protein